MNKYGYEDIEIGLVHSFEVQVKEDDLDSFRRLSGDVNPLHTSDSFAQSKGFPKKVVFGMLLASYYSALAGVYIPGENCLLYQVDVKFKRPVFVGDVLRVLGNVMEKNDLAKMLIIHAKIQNATGTTVSTAVIKVGFLDDKK